MKCEEKGKIYILNNTRSKYVISYRMDGGVIVEDKLVPKGISKCDFLYVLDKKENPIAILIELKGTSIRKAVSQVLGTINQYKTFLDSYSNVFCRIIVTSSTPNLKTDPSYISLANKIKKYNGNIIVKEKKMTEKDTTLY